jgi:hypothetical protein
MQPAETNMVLSDWKKELFDQRANFPWLKPLRKSDLWDLLNHVLDRITLPSSKVVVGCHESSEDVPLCWAAIRDGELLMMYARQSLRRDAELACAIEKEFRAYIVPVTDHREHFNPFEELKR